MPNWTENYVKINANQDVLDTIQKELTDDTANGLDLTKAYPMPDVFNDMLQGATTINGERHDVWRVDADGNHVAIPEVEQIEIINKYGTTQPVDWQYNNWGTKWGDCETTFIRVNENNLDIEFRSAWGEPFLLLNELANKYNVTFTNHWEIELNEGSGTTYYPFPNGDEVKEDHIKTLNEMRSTTRSIVKRGML